MFTPFGQKLLEEKLVTEQQLEIALARQKLCGQRLGDNLISLGYLDPEGLRSFLAKRPPAPKSLSETGLDPLFVAELALKHALFMGEFRLCDVSESMKLPVPVVEAAVDLLRREKLIEVKGADEFIKSSFRFSLTEQGRIRVGELYEICRYAGPAPVPLESYKKMVDLQTIKNIVVSPETVEKAFAHLTLGQSLLNRLGPAVSAGHPIFIYGPPGNGKTTIAETIGKLLPGTVYMPFSVIVGGQVIQVFDEVNHEPACSGKDVLDFDQRWIEVKRPVIMTGGELTLNMLELQFNQNAKYYEAPLQMKANNGLFIVDDFGRQKVAPYKFLNRWIVSLERNVDFLSLHTGVKFDIPFDQLIIFSTNNDPKALVDEAFLRRIRYKINIKKPTASEYKDIFKSVCRESGVEFKSEIVDYLIEEYYNKFKKSANACHPRDLVDHIID